MAKTLTTSLQPAQKARVKNWAKAQIIERASIFQMSPDALFHYLHKEAEMNPFLNWKPTHAVYPYSEFQKHEDSFWVQLAKQIDENLSDAHERSCAHLLLEELDSTGRLEKNALPMVVARGFPEGFVKKVIEKLQRFEPAGVFAFSVANQYQLQLLAAGFRKTDLCYKLTMYWDVLLAKGLRHVSIELHEGVEDCRNALQLLVRHGGPLQIEPQEIGVTSQEVTISSLDPVKITIRDDWSDMVSLDETLKDQAHFFQGNAQEAKQLLFKAHRLIDLVHQRKKNIREVSYHAARLQKEFLQSSANNRRVLSMQTLASLADVSLSTVSRLCDYLVLSFDGRNIRLRNLIMRSLARNEQGDELSSDQLIHFLKNKIIHEQHPLSDHQLAYALQKEGFCLTQMSIGRYRRHLRIPDCRARRAWVRYLPHEPRYWLDDLRM